MRLNHLACVATSLGITAISHAQVYSSTGHNIPIPDNNAVGAKLDIVVNDPGTVADLNVGVIITHSWQGDIIATIEHIGFGPPALLINLPGQTGPFSGGYSADNFGNLTTGQFFVLDDEAIGTYEPPSQGGVGPTSTGIHNVTGRWKPDGTLTDGTGDLSVFDGQPISGTWRLWVGDPQESGSLGSIRALSLTFPAPATLFIIGLAAVRLKGRRRNSD